MALNIPILATALFMVPMFYLLLASPAFLLVRLDIPQVAYIFRSVFVGYFLVLVSVGLVATTLFAVDGRVVQAVCIGGVTVFDLIWRRWMMPRIDALVAVTESGPTGAGAGLRRLHWAGMATNAVQLAITLAFIPALVATS